MTQQERDNLRKDAESQIEMTKEFQEFSKSVQKKILEDIIGEVSGYCDYEIIDESDKDAKTILDDLEKFLA